MQHIIAADDLIEISLRRSRSHELPKRSGRLGAKLTSITTPLTIFGGGVDPFRAPGDDNCRKKFSAHQFWNEVVDGNCTLFQMSDYGVAILPVPQKSEGARITSGCALAMV